MRIGLNEFVPGAFALPEQPVPIGVSGRGWGDLTPGRFAVPQTPVGGGFGDLVIGAFAVPQNPVLDGLGDMVPTAPMYPIIPNTVTAHADELAYSGGLTGFGSCGGGCGCDKCGMSGRGMGDINADFSKIVSDIEAGNYMVAFSDPVAGVPLWGWVGGVLVVYLFFFSGGQHSRASRAKRAARSGFQSARGAYA